MKIRIAAGVLVLVALAVFAVLLTPSYYRNWQFQGVLDDTAASRASLTRPPELLAVDIANQAAKLGLPVRPGQVKVVRSPGKLKIEAAYFVRIDLPLYTVDLHFHPSASR